MTNTSKTNLIITCPNHGDFNQSPSRHLKGKGCLECIQQENLIKFIENAKKVHHDKYKYDKIIYLNSKTELIITCREHGDFKQIANSHLMGHSCDSCGGTKSHTTESFIAKAKVVHGEKYIYDNVSYLNTKTELTITCRFHGDFKQIAKSHLEGHGCDKCGSTKSHTTESFIAKVKVVHGEKYIYDNVSYLNSRTKLIITCREHGDFMQQASSHLAGRGCLECSGLKKSTTIAFIKKAIEVHKDRYDYKEVDYKNNKTKVKITCKFHGVFNQAPKDHLRGNGCKTCNSSRGEVEIEIILKNLNIEFEMQYAFDDCKDKRKLLFDFAVFVNDEIKLIEFQGIQHEKIVYPSITISQHKRAINRDKIKIEYAKKKGIPLLIIQWKEIENLNELVQKFVNV